MLSSGLLPILLVLSVLELSWSLSDEDKKIILDEHNKYRSQVSPPAKAMMKMSWDMDLEADAQDHAKKCFWGQNGGPGRENLFATTSALDIKLAIEQWNGEKKFFNFTTFECNHEQMCDNYTQVVWAETTRIGCGSNSCKKINGFETENMHLFVCSYYPPGNTEDKTPFKEGSSCTMCPTDTVCENNLCVSALRTEKQKRKSDKTSVDPPKAAAPSTGFGLSLFLLPSATLVGLLL